MKNLLFLVVFLFISTLGTAQNTFECFQTAESEYGSNVISNIQTCETTVTVKNKKIKIGDQVLKSKKAIKLSDVTFDNYMADKTTYPIKSGEIKAVSLFGLGTLETITVIYKDNRTKTYCLK